MKFELRFAVFARLFGEVIFGSVKVIFSSPVIVFKLAVNEIFFRKFDVNFCSVAVKPVS